MTLNSIFSSGRKWHAIAVLLSALVLSFNSCKQEETTPDESQTIMQLINDNTNFTFLKAALTKAGLDATLGASGTYTLLAPTNDAFKAFGFTSEAALALAPDALIKAVMQYHILGTTLESSAIPTAINTPQQTQVGAVYLSKPVTLTTSAGSGTTVSVNGAYILQGDVLATNGIIHVIDRILLPPVYGDIPTTISQIPSIYALLAPTAGITFNLLNQAIAKAGTTTASSLTATGPLTVFAPTDNAFKAVGYDSLAITKATAAELQTLLAYHVVPDRLYTPILTSGASLTTSVPAATITIGKSTTGTTVTGIGNGGTAANIIGPDVTASNGVIHIIDRLLLPK